MPYTLATGVSGSFLELVCPEPIVGKNVYHAGPNDIGVVILLTSGFQLMSVTASGAPWTGDFCVDRNRIDLAQDPSEPGVGEVACTHKTPAEGAMPSISLGPLGLTFNPGDSLILGFDGNSASGEKWAAPNDFTVTLGPSLAGSKVTSYRFPYVDQGLACNGSLVDGLSTSWTLPSAATVVGAQVFFSEAGLSADAATMATVSLGGYPESMPEKGPYAWTVPVAAGAVLSATYANQCSGSPIWDWAGYVFVESAV